MAIDRLRTVWRDGRESEYGADQQLHRGDLLTVFVSDDTRIGLYRDREKLLPM